MIVALLALCVALGGSAYAASKINGNDIQNRTIAGKKLKNRTIKLRKISKATVQALKGQRGLRGPRGRRGRTGPKGANGADGSALAYARVASDGTIDAARAKGITQANLSHPSVGVYCFINLGFTPRNVVATLALEPGASGDEVLNASIPPPNTTLSCGDAVGIQIRHSAGANADLGFYVAFN
jgi:hypothetical protein